VAERVLCQRLVPAIRAFARRRLRTSDAVQEFTQEVLLLFVEALRKGAVEDPARAPGFVLGICRNLAFDRARKRERREELWSKYAPELAELSLEPLEHANHDVIHLEDCISQLSQRARDVMRLSFAEGRSHAEVARLLDVSEANARVLRHRTLQSLRECMQKPISWEAA
jgi:RNA polymerase sigma-70 factor (ECF subfamily)